MPSLVVYSDFPRSEDRRMAHELFAGFGECSASFCSDILVGHRDLGHGTRNSGLSNNSVELAGERLRTQALGKLRSRMRYMPGLLLGDKYIPLFALSLL